MSCGEVSPYTVMRAAIDNERYSRVRVCPENDDTDEESDESCDEWEMV